MRDLVRHHAGEFGFVVGRENQSAVDVEESAGQREGVDFIVIEDLDGEGHARVGVAHQVLTNAIDVFVDDRDR